MVSDLSINYHNLIDFKLINTTRETHTLETKFKLLKL